MKKVIVEAKLAQSKCETNLFYVDDHERGLYLNLEAAPATNKLLKPYVGQIVTISWK